MNFRVRGKQ